MDDHTATKIRELERRVDVLTTTSVVQCVALVFLLPLVPIVAIGFLLLLPILAFTHRYIPAFARQCGRFLKFMTNLVMAPKSSPS